MRHVEGLKVDFGRREGKRLILDVDGVLFDWLGAFTFYVQSRAAESMGVPLASTGPFNMATDLVNQIFGPDVTPCVRQRTQKFIQDFASGPVGSNLPIFPDALPALHRLSSAGYYFTAVSAPGTVPNVLYAREALFRRHKLDLIFDALHHLPLFGTKRGLVESYAEDMRPFYVDAVLSHCASVSTETVRPAWLIRPGCGNSEVPEGILVFDGLERFADHVIGESAT